MKRLRRVRAIRIAKRVATHIILIAAVLFALFPIYFIIITSFSTLPIASITAHVLLPQPSQFTLASYHAILYDQSPSFETLLMNSLIFA